MLGQGLYRLIGKLVRSQRENAGMTQDELAKKVDLTRTSLTNIENGKQRLQLHTLYALAEVFNVPITTFLPSADTAQSEIDVEELPEDLRPEEVDWVKKVLS